MPKDLTAKHFIQELESHQSSEEREKYRRYFRFGEGTNDEFIGVRMGQVFALARDFIDMPIAEIERLLESPIHEIRAGAVSVMDWRARSNKTSATSRQELFDLYVRRNDRINSWDLVDRSAVFVIGGYLFDKPRDILYQLAGSENVWERRTAIISTSYFIRKGEVDDTFRIAEMLLDDEQDTIHKATGWMLRYAGEKAHKEMLTFLDTHAAAMPRLMLRNAFERLDKKQREHYLGLRKGDRSSIRD